MIFYVEFQKYTPKFKILEEDITEERAKVLEKEARLWNATPHRTTIRSIQDDFCGDEKDRIKS